jgi:hypothetical protein
VKSVTIQRGIISFITYLSPQSFISFIHSYLYLSPSFLVKTKDWVNVYPSYGTASCREIQPVWTCEKQWGWHDIRNKASGKCMLLRDGLSRTKAVTSGSTSTRNKMVLCLPASWDGPITSATWNSLASRSYKKSMTSVLQHIIVNCLRSISSWSQRSLQHLLKYITLY